MHFTINWVDVVPEETRKLIEKHQTRQHHSRVYVEKLTSPTQIARHMHVLENTIFQNPDILFDSILMWVIGEENVDCLASDKRWMQPRT